MTRTGHGYREPSDFLRAKFRMLHESRRGRSGLEQLQLTVETLDCALGDACITSRGARCGKRVSCHDNQTRR
jgi:hypothetical protein